MTDINVNERVIEIRFTNNFDEASALRDQGYEPIECAFGQFGSVLGRFSLDHHGEERTREGVAIRACRDLFGALNHDPRFVVTGTPDADAVLAIVALSGVVPKEMIEPGFYELVNAYDLDPIGIDLLQVPHGLTLAYFNQIQGLTQSESGFRRAIQEMIRVLMGKVAEADFARVARADAARRRTAREGILSLQDLDGWNHPIPADFDAEQVCRGLDLPIKSWRVAVVQSAVWGFDQWYRAAPVVVSFASRIGKVTVGCPDRDTAEHLFGPGGLMAVWPTLGKGWGGREAIGGSPRGMRLQLQDAHHTAAALVARLAEKRG